MKALRVALLVAAIWALRRELTGLDASHLVGHFRSYGISHVALAFACTAGSFLMLGAIELVALRATAGERTNDVPRGGAVATAFVANAFSHSIGLSLLTGAAVRSRAYARYGFDSAAVARVTGFATLTTTLGLLAAGAAALLASAAPRARGVDVAAHPVGAMLALVVVAYFAWSLFGRGDSIGWGRLTLPRPSPAIAAAQVGMSAMDWLLTGAVLFAFLPASLGIGFWSLLRAYMIAQAVGAMSHVPAAAGVLEVVVVALLAGTAPATDRGAVIASLVMFRLVYYLAPLIIAMALAGVTELRRPRGSAGETRLEGAGAR